MRTTLSINGFPTAFHEIFGLFQLDLIPLELDFLSIYVSHMLPLNGKPLLHMMLTSLLRDLSFDLNLDGGRFL